MPRLRLAAEFGVSNVAIAKRCRALNLPQPPLGYWAKIEAGAPIDDAVVPKEISEYVRQFQNEYKEHIFEQRSATKPMARRTSATKKKEAARSDLGRSFKSSTGKKVKDDQKVSGPPTSSKQEKPLSASTPLDLAKSHSEAPTAPPNTLTSSKPWKQLTAHEALLCISEKPRVELHSEFGVSDLAVAKRDLLLDLAEPPLGGYRAKDETRTPTDKVSIPRQIAESLQQGEVRLQRANANSEVSKAMPALRWPANKKIAGPVPEPFLNAIGGVSAKAIATNNDRETAAEVVATVIGTNAVSLSGHFGGFRFVTAAAGTSDGHFSKTKDVEKLLPEIKSIVDQWIETLPVKSQVSRRSQVTRVLRLARIHTLADLKGMRAIDRDALYRRLKRDSATSSYATYRSAFRMFAKHVMSKPSTLSNQESIAIRFLALFGTSYLYADLSEQRNVAITAMVFLAGVEVGTIIELTKLQWDQLANDLGSSAKCGEAAASTTRSLVEAYLRALPDGRQQHELIFQTDGGKPIYRKFIERAAVALSKTVAGKEMSIREIRAIALVALNESPGVESPTGSRRH